MEYDDQKQEPLTSLAYAMELANRNIHEPEYHSNGFETIQSEITNTVPTQIDSTSNQIISSNHHMLTSPQMSNHIGVMPTSSVNMPTVSQSYVSTSYASASLYQHPYQPGFETDSFIEPLSQSTNLAMQSHDQASNSLSNFSPILSHPETTWGVSSPISQMSTITSTCTQTKPASISEMYSEYSRLSHSSPSKSTPADALPSTATLTSLYSPSRIQYSPEASQVQSPQQPSPINLWGSPNQPESPSCTDVMFPGYFGPDFIVTNGDVKRGGTVRGKRGKRGRPRGSRSQPEFHSRTDPMSFAELSSPIRKKRGRGTRVRGANPGIRARVRSRSPLNFPSDSLDNISPIYKRGASTRGRGAMRMCRTCINCLRTDDCAECVFCKDKSKFGGSNKLKQKCLKKQCVLKGKFIEHDNTDSTPRYIVQKTIPADPPPLSHPPMPNTAGSLPSDVQEYIQSVPLKVWMQVEVSRDLNPSYDFT